MKLFFRLTFLLLLFTLGASAQENQKNLKAVIQTTIYCDHCRECETCGKGMKSGLLKIKGVRMYELDEVKMTLTVYYNGEKTDLDTIRKTISELGYDADGVKADPLAYEKLDPCCKKES